MRTVSVYARVLLLRPAACCCCLVLLVLLLSVGLLPLSGVEATCLRGVGARRRRRNRVPDIEPEKLLSAPAIQGDDRRYRYCGPFDDDDAFH